MTIEIGTKVYYRLYGKEVIGVVVDRHLKDPPRYDIRTTNGTYVRALRGEDLEPVDGKAHTDDRGGVSDGA